MYASVIENGDLHWREVPDPRPGPGEVLVRVHAAGVNRADVMQRQGHYPPPPGASPYPGLECSGVIAELGPGVTGHRAGDQVCALLAGGGYAELVAVPAGQLLPIPAGVSLADAAALPEVACTVWSNLTDVARLRAGETLLVHGGGGGIGTFAIQYAKALGATVVVTARAAKHERLAALGADQLIDYTAADFTEVAPKAEVILDIIGAKYLGRNVRALAEGGRLVVIGLQGGRTGEIDLSALMAKRGTVAGTMLRSRPVSDKSRIVSGTRDAVWPLVESGAIRAIVDTSLPLSEAAAAHRRMEVSDHLGKILLVAE